LRGLRRILFGLKREKESGEWRKLHTAELNDMNSSTHFSDFKFEKNEMGRACSAYGGEVHSGFWWGNLREKEHLDDTGVNGRKRLRWIFRQ
jgi:hypothetical protein